MVYMGQGPRCPHQAIAVMLRIFTGNGTGQNADGPGAHAYRKLGGLDAIADAARRQREALAAKPAPEPAKPSFRIDPERAKHVEGLIRTKCLEWETDLRITWKSPDHAKVVEPNGDVRLVVIWKEGSPQDYLWPTPRVTQNGNVRIGNSCAVGSPIGGKSDGSMASGVARHKVDVGGQMCTN